METTELMGLATSLSELALKGTATTIHAKIESIKSEKDLELVRTTYDEIVNRLQEERAEAILIAQAYKQELDKVAISDEDIEYLQKTIAKVIDAVNAYQIKSILGASPDVKAKTKAGVEVLTLIKDFVSKDVLKTMQLLGFNYKAAIGEPFTQICANAIQSLGSSENKTENKTRSPSNGKKK